MTRNKRILFPLDDKPTSLPTEKYGSYDACVVEAEVGSNGLHGGDGGHGGRTFIQFTFDGAAINLGVDGATSEAISESLTLYAYGDAELRCLAEVFQDIATELRRRLNPPKPRKKPAKSSPSDIAATVGISSELMKGLTGEHIHQLQLGAKAKLTPEQLTQLACAELPIGVVKEARLAMQNGYDPTALLQANCTIIAQTMRDLLKQNLDPTPLIYANPVYDWKIGHRLKLAIEEHALEKPGASKQETLEYLMANHPSHFTEQIQRIETEFPTLKSPDPTAEKYDRNELDQVKQQFPDFDADWI